MIRIETTATDTLSAMALYRNVLSEGTLAASSAAIGFDAANALGPQTNDSWKATALPATLAVMLGSAVACDCGSIIGHTLGSSGSTVYVEYFSGSWQVAASLTPATDADILFLFGAQTSTQWRIRITGSTIPVISIAMIGPRLVIPEGVQAGYTPVNLGLSVDLLRSETRGGQFLGNRVQRTGAGTSIPLAPQERAWVETAAKPFIAHFNSGKPFVWAAAPAVLADDMAYCWRSGGVLSANYGAGALYGSMSMEVQAYAG